eukprot:3140896-Rhodomonas_salina.1
MPMPMRAGEHGEWRRAADDGGARRRGEAACLENLLDQDDGAVMTSEDDLFSDVATMVRRRCCCESQSCVDGATITSADTGRHVCAYADMRQSDMNGCLPRECQYKERMQRS